MSALQESLAGRYNIVRELAHGGMAVLYLAVDIKHDRQVVVKVLRSELGHSLGAERFLREIKVTAKLQHPHILPLYDSGDAGEGQLYYVTPYIVGESLRDRLDQEQRLLIRDALRIAREVADALAYAHEEGVVHRDIKPGNILLSRGRHAIVADFGIARALVAAGAESLTDVGVALGTPAYMSPEQLLGTEQLDARSDIYSFGCLLFEMLTGKIPFMGADGRVALGLRLSSDPTPPSNLRPEIPRRVDEIVMRALHPDPASRWDSAMDIGEALGSALSALDPAATGAFAIPVPDVRTPTPLSLSVSQRHGSYVAQRPNTGSLVCRTCNRWSQVNSFDAFFRVARQAPSRVSFCVVHGDEGQGHESLVERLVATRIASCAAELAGEEGGTVVDLKIPWPDETSFEVAKRDLLMSLFREVAPSYLGDDLSAAALVRLASASLSPVIVVQHDIRATNWNNATDQLIRWYASEFWSSRRADEQKPLFVVFLKVIYGTEQPAFRFPWQRRRLAKKEIIERMRLIVEDVGNRASMALLAELAAVTVDDVKRWFDQNNIYGSEKQRLSLAASLFAHQRAKPLSEVEPALERIHREFVQETLTQQRSLAW